MAPIVAKPTPEGAVFAFTYMSYTGTGVLFTAILSGLLSQIGIDAQGEELTTETYFSSMADGS